MTPERRRLFQAMPAPREVFAPVGSRRPIRRCALCPRPLIHGQLVEIMRDGREAHPACVNRDRP